MTKNKNSFTLLELLIIISVLIILIGIIIPRIKGMQDAAIIAKVKTELQSIQSAVESYYINPGSRQTKVYPPSTVSLATNFLTNNIPQIVGAPLYDPWIPGGTTEFNYVLSANAKYYVIASVGPDGTYTRALGVGSVGAITKGLDDYCVTNGSGC